MTRIDTDLVVACVEHICATTEEGAILVFVPGWEAISEVTGKLTDSNHPALSGRTPCLLRLLRLD